MGPSHYFCESSSVRTSWALVPARSWIFLRVAKSTFDNHTCSKNVRIIVFYMQNLLLNISISKIGTTERNGLFAMFICRFTWSPSLLFFSRLLRKEGKCIHAINIIVPIVSHYVTGALHHIGIKHFMLVTLSINWV